MVMIPLTPDEEKIVELNYALAAERAALQAERERVKRLERIHKEMFRALWHVVHRLEGQRAEVFRIDLVEYDEKIMELSTAIDPISGSLIVNASINQALSETAPDAKEADHAD